MTALLQGKRLLVTGVVTTDSIAYATAAAALAHGATIALTSFERDAARTSAAASELGAEVEVWELDVNEPEHFVALERRAKDAFGALDGVLHAVAFAPRTALAGDFLAADPADVEFAFRTSAYSYAALARLLVACADSEGASIVGLDFDAAGAWPVYNWMGVCKASLEAINRYVARDLGTHGHRSNLVAAGPLTTRAASGIPDFGRLTDAWASTAPLPWDVDDPSPVADAACFLLSDLARSITGEILHVDGGHHAMAAPLRSVPV